MTRPNMTAPPIICKRRTESIGIGPSSSRVTCDQVWPLGERSWRPFSERSRISSEVPVAGTLGSLPSRP